ncbi:MAG: hypothetical protein EZS28_040107, partial [Streblomastix strix]
SDLQPRLPKFFPIKTSFNSFAANNKFVRLEGSIQQTITGRLKYVSPFGETYDETQDPVANTYLTQSEVDAKLTNVVTTNTTQSITGAKTFNSNVSATGFAKTDKDDTSVLLAGGGDRLLSEFSSGGASIEDLTSQVAINITATGFNYSSLAFIKIGNLYLYQMQVTPKQEGFAPSMNIKIGTLPSQYAPTVSELYVPVGGPYGAFKPHICSDGDIRCYTVNDNWNQQISFFDEALLDAAGLSEFPELYAYIHEREPKPIIDGIANQIIVGPQYLQDQVKDNDDKLNVQPIPQPIAPIEIPQVQIFKIPKNQLAPNVQMYNPADEYFYFYKLRNKVVYNIGLYLSNDFMGFIFTNFLEELWPFSKHALVLGDDVGHKQNVMGYISEKGPYIGVSIGSVDQVTSIKGNTHLAIAGVYYTDYEPLKRATNDVNGDGKINIVDDWHVNSVIDGMKSVSWVQDVVQKQTEIIDDGVQPYDPKRHIMLKKVQYVHSISKLK